MMLDDDDRTALQLKCWQDGGIEGFRFFVENVWHPPCSRKDYIPFKEYNWAWARLCLGNRVAWVVSPRGHGKSSRLVEPMAAWWSIHHPDSSVLIASSTPLLAHAMIESIEEKQRVEWWADGWPGPGAVYSGLIAKTSKTPTRDLWYSTRSVKRIDPNIRGAGILGVGITGFHWDLILPDDVIGEENSQTEGMRRKVEGFWNRKLMGTQTGLKLLWAACTLYHPNDLNAQKIGSGMPVCNEYRSAIVGDINDPDAKPMDSDFFTIEELRDKYEEMGPVDFALQFENDASAAEGAFIKRDWLEGAAQDIPEDPAFVKVIMVGDLAYSDTKGSDYTAIVVAGKTTRGEYVALDAIRHRFDSIDGVAATWARLYHHWKPHQHKTETGPGAMNQLHRQLRTLLQDKHGISGLGELRHTPSAGKAISAKGLQAHLNSGVWKIPYKPNSVWAAIRGELLSFPNGTHDDLFDALAYADNELTGARTGNASPKTGYAEEATWARI